MLTKVLGLIISNNKHYPSTFLKSKFYDGESNVHSYQAVGADHKLYRAKHENIEHQSEFRRVYLHDRSRIFYGNKRVRDPEAFELSSHIHEIKIMK